MLRRIRAVFMKEFTQLRRDRTTFAMILLVPILQLILFGYAIDNNPKHLATAIYCRDNGPFSRDIVAALVNTDYFKVVAHVDSDAEGDRLLATGDVYFVLSIPENFTRDLLSGRRPRLLFECDTSDPTATGNALASAATALRSAVSRDLVGAAALHAYAEDPIEVRIHRCYNPEAIMCYNIVPGLIAIVLCLTGIFMTALSLTREVERGTMENMMTMPVRPIEMMAGKIVPYLMIGVIQSIFILALARLLFDVPILGNLFVLMISLVIFITSNLSIGFTISSFARNQLQALQLTVMVFFPSMLLSGFMFPFAGMPQWAQMLGNCLPITYFLRIVRGVMLKGNGWGEAEPHIWPMIVITLLLAVVATRVYKRTLD